VLSTYPAAPILTSGDLPANVVSFASHLDAANLCPKQQHTYLHARARSARAWPSWTLSGTSK
jgi:hypothetical protein